MKKNQNSLNNLKPNRSPWHHPETVAIRVPKVFKKKFYCTLEELTQGKK